MSHNAESYAGLRALTQLIYDAPMPPSTPGVSVEEAKAIAMVVAGYVTEAQAEVANAFVRWAMKNEIAEPPLDWAWFGEIARRYSPLHEEHEPRDSSPGGAS